jgi:hypothetical protein
MDYALRVIDQRNVKIYEINAEREIEMIKKDVINILNQEGGNVNK